MTILEKIAYIRGKFEGMGLDRAESGEARILSDILDVLRNMGEELERMCAALDSTGQAEPPQGETSSLPSLPWDDAPKAAPRSGGRKRKSGGKTGSVRSFQDVCMERALSGNVATPISDSVNFQISCPSCGQKLLIGDSDLEQGNVTCSNCGQKFSLIYDDPARQGQGISPNAGRS